MNRKSIPASSSAEYDHLSRERIIEENSVLFFGYRLYAGINLGKGTEKIIVTF